MPLNPCELEIDLFCHGLRVPPNVSLEGARGIRRTRAGLGSGLELTIPTGSWLKPAIWMNAPVVEKFVQTSHYMLCGRPDDTRSSISGMGRAIPWTSPGSRIGTID